MQNSILYSMNNDRFRKSINNTITIKSANYKILKDINRNRGFNLNSPAPEFTLTGIVDGVPKDVSLSDYKGKWVVVFFYGSDFTFV